MANTNPAAPLSLDFRCTVYGREGWARRVDADTFEVELDGEGGRTDYWVASQVVAVREAA